MSNIKPHYPSQGMTLDQAFDVLKEDALQPVDTFEVTVRRAYADAMEILLKKQHDYGPRAIADAPGGPMNGLLVRMHDKQSRLVNLLITNKVDPQVSESVEDTLMDLANYAMIGLLVARGHWPGTEGN